MHFTIQQRGCSLPSSAGQVSNPEVLQRSGLSAIGDILRHRRLSLFCHVAYMDLGVPADDVLRLMVDTYEGRKPMASRRRLSVLPRNFMVQHGTFDDLA